MKQLKTLKDNFLEVFSNWKYSLFAVFIFIVMESIFNYLTDYDLVFGNLGSNFYYSEIGLQIIISLLFALFVTISVYKYVMFSNFSMKSNASSGIGTFFGILVAGCPACSITLASYIGLAGVISLLPWYGLELKIIAIPLLLYAIYSLLISLKVCNIIIFKHLQVLINNN